MLLVFLRVLTCLTTANSYYGYSIIIRGLYQVFGNC